MFGCLRKVFKKYSNRKKNSNNNKSFLHRAFLKTKRRLKKFVQKSKKDKSKAGKRSCIPQQIPQQEDDEHYYSSEFGCGQTIIDSKSWNWETISSFPSSSSGSNPYLSFTYNDLEVLEYSCHHPDAIKPTFHRNSAVLSSSEEFTIRYKEEELLGEGGFSQVYAGERRSTSTPVAIKHIRKKDVQFVKVNCQGNVYDEILEVFLLEQAAGRLGDGSFDNPAVIGLMDTLHLETEVIIVMERPPDTVDGHDYLFEVQYIPEDQIKVIFKQIINAALLMHKNGVFHRDLKLTNILVNRNKGTPEIRVIDFGCGDFVENEPFSEFNGTPEFAPPEVYREETYMAEATTVWQIGAMLYIYCIKDRFETSVYMTEDNEVLENVSMECNDFLCQCLALDPNQRPTLEDLLLHPWLELTGPHSNYSFLEVLEYSCHHPDAIKTTSHHNSAVLSSSEEFTIRYKEEELLGESGYSQVYAGERRSTSTPVAIKHIPKRNVQFVKVNCQGIVYDEILEVFLLEQAAGRLCDSSFENPVVIGLMDTFDLGTEVIIVMERPPDTVDGHDYLFEVHYIPEDQIKVIFKQIINAALLMHKNGVFHRDLKLDNILVKRNKGTPEIRVIDFGCGDFVENEPFSKFNGTPEFAPPEVYREETYMAEATTVWQIGAMLYIYCIRDRFETLVYMTEDNEVLENVTMECNDFLSQCLALDPNQRPTLEDLLLHPWLELTGPHSNDSFLEVLEYSCHNPDAIKPTFHRNSAVLSSSEEFTIRYKEEELLGEGGYSQVYAGERRSTSTPVAIKHIRKKNVQFVKVNCQGNVYDEILEVFLLEQAAGRLCDGSFDNPAVIGLIDIFHLETEVIIVMERPPDTVDGHDYLFEVQYIPEDQITVIFKQIINAALLMHKNGVFHRDLKLTNILVDGNKGTPEVRVIDFGCGDFVENEPFSEFNGTPEYAPPEVYREETYMAEATTVWQIGVMLYIYCIRDSFETSVYMTEDNEVLENVSMECNNFLSQCLALDPMQRPTLEDLLLHPWLELTGPHSNYLFLEVLKYFCHHPDAIKTTFHRNSAVLRSSEEFTIRYKEEELLGESGYSQVYAGERRSTSTPVAIKHIRKKNVQFVKVNCQGNVYDEILEVFLLEQAAGRLCDSSFENPAVIGLMDTFDLGTEVIIVMERPPDTVDGHDYLFEVHYIPEDQITVIFKQIINAALLMHKNGVFHRDLKLDNILVKRNKGTPEIRVIDFGCGDFVENEPFSKFNGTPEFAPPEVYREETYMAEATTVWQIGAMLYIYCIRDRFETSVYMTEDNEVLENVSMECNDFLCQCLALDPNQRPTLEDLLLHPWLELTGPYEPKSCLQHGGHCGCTVDSLVCCL